MLIPMDCPVLTDVPTRFRLQLSLPARQSDTRPAEPPSHVDTSAPEGLSLNPSSQTVSLSAPMSVALSSSLDSSLPSGQSLEQEGQTIFQLHARTLWF